MFISICVCNNGMRVTTDGQPAGNEENRSHTRDRVTPTMMNKRMKYELNKK